MPLKHARQVEHVLAALSERHDSEPALRYLRHAISSSRFSQSNQVVLDANVVPVLAALTDPALRLRVVRSKSGRPRMKQWDKAIKRNEKLIHDLDIYLAVSARILERLNNARPNQTRGFRNLIGIKAIRDEISKEFDLPESAIRKAYAKVERRLERRERLEASPHLPNALTTLRQQ